MAGTGIDTVLFDLDDTICNYRRDGAEVLAHAFDEVGAEPYFTIGEYLDRIRTMEADAATFAELREACFVELTQQAGHNPAVGRELARAYGDERDQTNVAFCPGARRAVESLADRYSLGLVTNGGPDIQVPKLESLGIDDTFDAVVFAGYDTAAKPDPAPFRRALSTVGSTPERAVHVGNSIASDVAGAKRAGLRAVWIDDGRDPDPEPDYTVDSLEELTDPPWQ